MWYYHKYTKFIFGFKILFARPFQQDDFISDDETEKLKFSLFFLLLLKNKL